MTSRPPRTRRPAGPPAPHALPRDALVGEVGAGQLLTVCGRGPAGSAEDRRRGRFPAGHGLGDALTLEGVDQAGGITDQQDPPEAGVVPTMPILSHPPSSLGMGRSGGPVDESEAGQVLEVGRQHAHGAGATLAVGQRPDADPDLATPPGPEIDPYPGNARHRACSHNVIAGRSTDCSR